VLLRRTRVAAALLLSAACADAPDDAREAEVVSILARADEATIRARPALSVGKYATMAGGAFEYYRGSLPVYRSDWRSAKIAPSRFALDAPLVPSLGDAHPENFGTMRASDGSVALEPNDFDSADRAPYLWDVRRLASGMALAAHLAQLDEPSARNVGRAVAEGYSEAIRAAATGTAPGRITDGGGNAYLEDLFRRSNRDLLARAEHATLTVMDGSTRRLRRGVLDPTKPDNVYLDLPDAANNVLPATLASYRETLVGPPAPEFFTVLDAVRELGSGVASYAKVRVIVLVRGPTDDAGDDVVLELKELVDSSVAGFYPPGVAFDDVATRVRESSRAAWARPDADPLWGTSTFVGLPCQIKTEAEGFKTIRVAKMTGALGTVDVLADLGHRLGALIARVHAVSVPDTGSAAGAVAAIISQDPKGFADEQADVASAYAAQVVGDLSRFQDARVRFGSLLGVPVSEADAPSPDLAALFGVPPNTSYAAVPP
jgi:uncharacterized protein (DUF2252 family)